MIAETDEKITVSEAATLAGVSDRTIRNWMAAGLLAARAEPTGRKIRRRDLLALLEEKGYAPSQVEPVELFSGNGTEDNTEEPEPRMEAAVVAELAETAAPERVEAPATLNMLLTPLVDQLTAERERTDRLHRENLELAGRVGFLQAKLQETERKLLTATTVPMEEPEEAVETAEPPPAPWWRRLFGAG